jgi:CRISPR-associated endonuclease/helicase Cas3
LIDYKRLIAKTDPIVSLFDHCCAVGEMAGRLWELQVIDRTLISREHLCLLAALHDIGKCHPYFQRIGEGLVPYIDELMREGYLPSVKQEYRHEIGTEYILQKVINISYKSLKHKRAFAKILRLHHQKAEHSYTLSPKKDEWKVAQIELVQALQDYFGVKVEEIAFDYDDVTCAMLWGIVILADWLASGSLEDKAERLFAYSRLPLKPIQQMFKLPSLRPLQQECEKLVSHFSENLPQAIILEAPMGEGKTEAAIYLASGLIAVGGKQGFYIALPTMATARQMEQRASDTLHNNGLDSALLVHSMAWLDKDIPNQEEVDKSWFAPTKRALLSNYAVGTVDQAMMSVLKIKQGILRLLGLSSKVLIIDEMHAYDAYMQQIIYRLLDWCKALDIPVIILSATLPTERRKRLAQIYGCEENMRFSQDYPLITAFCKDNTVKEIAVPGSCINKTVKWDQLEYDSYNSIARHALSAIKGGGCGCVIMNTVSDAQEVYFKAKELDEAHASDTKIILFHSRFLAKDRQKIEEESINAFGKESSNRPYKALLIATQVVEQSLDVDFDYMASALAPIDLLLQRCGRLHRHDRIRPDGLTEPVFTVLINKEDSEHRRIGRIYSPWILKQTLKALENIKSINIPADIRLLIEGVYKEYEFSENSDNDLEEWIRYKSEKDIFEGKAKQLIFPVPSDYFFPTQGGDFFEEGSSDLVNLDACSRISGNTVKIIVLPESLWDEEKLKQPNLSFARDALKYSVSIFSNLEIVCNEEQVKCGGYLKGLYAVKGEDNVTIFFNKRGEAIAKKYIINDRYGLKEEQ